MKVRSSNVHKVQAGHQTPAAKLTNKAYIERSCKIMSCYVWINRQQFTCGLLMKCVGSLTCCIMSSSVHALMLLMKLPVMCTAVEVLMMLSVETIKVKPWHAEAIKCTVKTKCRASWKMSVLPAVEEKWIIIVVIVEEAVKTENIVKVCTASSTIKWAVTKLIILPSLLLVTQHLVCCSHDNIITSTLTAQ